MGRDILSRVLYGSRVSLGVAIPSVALAVLTGTTLGVGLGYSGGAPDLLAMRLFDVLFAFPPILLAIALVAALGPSTVNLVLTIAVLTLPQFAVLARSATLALKPQDFVQAARALGASHGRILGAHVLPNIAPTLAVQASLSLSIVILVEAALSFLGLGTQPPAPSWGSMLSRGPPVHDHRPVAGAGAGAGHHARGARLQPARGRPARSPGSAPGERAEEEPMSPSVRIAAVQARPESDLFDDMWNGGDVAHAVDLLEAAARAGAACICFPELYPRVGEAEICAAARRLRVFVVAGLIEGTRASWHNTATVIGPDGRILGRQPKCFPTQNEIDNGVVAGKGYRVIETDIGRLGIVICADFAFFSEGVESLVEQGVDIIFNPSWWFALGEAYPGTVIGRHMQYGKPVIGVDIAACALRLPDADGRLVERFPRAGGYSTVCVPPPIASLAELAEWFRTKAGGTNAAAGFVQSLGEDEGILYADVDIAAVRRFPGYFYRMTSP